MTSAQKVPICCVVACLMPEYGIGFQGTLPWRLAKEMKYFRQLTTATFDPSLQNAVVMGRKTWESIPPRFRPLPGRLNVVVSHSFPAQPAAPGPAAAASPDHVIRTNSLHAAIQHLTLHSDALALERIYVIGGGEIYQQCIPLSDHLFITKISHDLPVPMDTFLDRAQISAGFREQPLGALQRALPPAVALPVDAQHPTVAENGYVYSLTLWSRAPY